MALSATLLLVCGLSIWATLKFLLPTQGPLSILIELVLGISLCMGAAFTSLGIVVGFALEAMLGKKLPFWVVPIWFGV